MTVPDLRGELCLVCKKAVANDWCDECWEDYGEVRHEDCCYQAQEAAEAAAEAARAGQ